MFMGSEQIHRRGKYAIDFPKLTHFQSNFMTDDLCRQLWSSRSRKITSIFREENDGGHHLRNELNYVKTGAVFKYFSDPRS